MTKARKCDVCGVEFDVLARNFGRGRHRYCSAKCRQVADNRRHYRRRNPPKSVDELKRACVICGTVFVTDPQHPNALTCSVKCNEARMNAMRRRESAERLDQARRECVECGKPFLPNKFATGVAKYCSPECAKTALARQRAQADARPYDKRLHRTEWRKAKKACLARDGSACRLCGSVSRLNVHHIFHRTQTEMNDHSDGNLITLCDACHRKMHVIKVGRVDGEIVVSGAVFDLLGVKSVRVV